MKVLREKEYHMLFSEMQLSPLFLERHLIETDRMRPQGICLSIDVRYFSEIKATFPAVFEKYLTEAGSIHPQGVCLPFVCL